MGLVYSPERVGASEIPADSYGQAQYDAAVLLGESLAEITSNADIARSGILAYMVYGSAARPFYKKADRRSDVDLLVVIDDQNGPADTGVSVGDRINAVGGAYHTDVGVTLYKRTDLTDGVRINPFYAEHLDDIRGFVSQPSSIFFSQQFSQSEQMTKAIFGGLPFAEAWPFGVEYLKSRREQFQTQLDQVDQDITQLQGPFELPRNLGRTLGDLFLKYSSEHAGTYYYDQQTDDMVSPFARKQDYWEKLMVVAQYTGTLGLIGSDVEKLQTLDAEYTHLLEETVAGTRSLSDYNSWLCGVYTESLERAFKVVDVADAIVYRIAEMAHEDPQYDQIQFDESFLQSWYPQDPEYCRELFELRHRAGEVTPISYNIKNLLFNIAPRHPELAQRFEDRERFRRQCRRESDAEIARMLEERKKD